MNHETTCCQASAPEASTVETTVATRDGSSNSYVTPVWHARRTDHGVELEVTLPGVTKEALELEVRGSHLVLEARRPGSANDGRLIHGQPAPDGYRLKLRLGESLDGSGLRATLEAGILRASVPLVEAAQPKKIEIL
ncbi:hypothetical protein HAHE_42000 [Haloferula helveola]|uniref:SHSP domain-containing protein n=1 Tax=Haloferula helveola TaxID=490095 RepID=A0ABN6H9D6_9BACT|nr:hypothetical protein HAHE_42000 [Haloferula helveola]